MLIANTVDVIGHVRENVTAVILKLAKKEYILSCWFLKWKKKWSLQGKHVESVEHDLCPWPPRPPLQTTKDFWVIVLPPVGGPSQSLALLLPGEDTKPTWKDFFLSCFWIISLNSCAEKLFCHPLFFHYTHWLRKCCWSSEKSRTHLGSFIC